ncbi:MAG: hypothetical protein OXB98_09495, partial [Bryobacterales bacterium]|nr:hypothetical protein [Bryobacterales bacterium]
DRLAKLAAPLRYAPPAIPLGRETVNALTFEVDQLPGAGQDHPYKGGIEDLRDINAYSRGEHHAEIEDDPSGESSEEELKGFCRRVLGLTRGM